MAITPWYVSDTAPAWVIPLTLDNGLFNVSALTTSNFLLIIKNTDANPPSEVSGAGTFTNLTAGSVSGTGIITPAQITYIPNSTDTSTLGNFAVFVAVNYPNGTKQTLSVGVWQVIPH